jgi:hypothetical protein
MGLLNTGLLINTVIRLILCFQKRDEAGATAFFVQAININEFPDQLDMDERS